MVKNPPAAAGDAGLIPGWGRSPGEGNGNPVQDSFFFKLFILFLVALSLCCCAGFLYCGERGDYSS